MPSPAPPRCTGVGAKPSSACRRANSYELFGSVVSGGDVVAAIDAVGTRSGKPNEDVVIESVTIAEAN